MSSATIGNSVTSIGDAAFYNCTSLISVTIPNSVTSIGESTFCSCTSLTSVTIPNSVTSIGDNAFSQCYHLTIANIPEGVTSIGAYSFQYCPLSSVTIPSSVTSIGDCAFEVCTSLTSVTIGRSVATIGFGAFWMCIKMNNVTIGSSVTYIGDGAFIGCSNLTSITFLGLTAPTYVGKYWISHTNAEITGHASSTSNFPAPGNTFYGLMMAESYPIEYMTSWKPDRDAYKFGNPSTVWSVDGNCFGMSSTAILYYLRYHSGLSSASTYPCFPHQDEGSLNTVNLNPVYYTVETTGVLNNVTFAILLHQRWGQGDILEYTDIGEPGFDQAIAFKKLEASIKDGVPALMSLGPKNRHSVVAYGLIEDENGKCVIYISDPNIPNAIKMAYYYENDYENHKSGEFYYNNGFTTWSSSEDHSGFLIRNVHQLSPVWFGMITAHSREPLIDDHGKIVNEYHFVVADEKVAVWALPIDEMSRPDYFGTDSESFFQGIPHSAGIVENGMQAYAIWNNDQVKITHLLWPPPEKIGDPAPESSTIVDLWANNDSGNIAGYGFMLNITSAETHDCNITDNPNGFELSVGHEPIIVNLTLFSWNEGGFYQLNATKLAYKAGDVVNLTIADWTGLNSTKNSVVTVVVTPDKGNPTSYKLVNEIVPTNSNDNSFLTYDSFLLILTIEVITVIAIAVFVAMGI